mmetsp:Transcript_8806/g.19389  ORF Transcript_8806/g.19389 Transcript_8806/m.19389 type:complete len:224 (+) Transcript_8806:1059-1730(+)
MPSTSPSPPPRALPIFRTAPISTKAAPALLEMPMTRPWYGPSPTLSFSRRIFFIFLVLGVSTSSLSLRKSAERSFSFSGVRISSSSCDLVNIRRILAFFVDHGWHGPSHWIETDRNQWHAPVPLLAVIIHVSPDHRALLNRPGSTRCHLNDHLSCARVPFSGRGVGLEHAESCSQGNHFGRSFVLVRFYSYLAGMSALVYGIATENDLPEATGNHHLPPPALG